MANSKEDLENRLAFIETLKKEKKLMEDRLKSDLASLDLMERKKRLAEMETNDLILANEYAEIMKGHKEGTLKLTKKQLKELENVESIQSDITSSVNKESKNRERLVNILKETSNVLKSSWGILMGYDKTIKSTILNLGMSGVKAENMRNSFENSAQYVARLGGNIEDIGTIMQGYADETGRARALTASMVENITAIGKGTGIGVEQATQLGAQFELMGYDAKSTMEYVQGVVDTSERMGVNTAKVLKNVSSNFKKLSKFNFQQGVKGYAQMATYAEKMKIDMGQALDSAESANSLEKAIDLAAQLQVMGGEFAKTDPFELLYLSRNDPAGYTKKINEMTKGVVTFRKMSDGTFEKFISPADRDRLKAVEKSLGMQSGELTTQALRMADMEKMRKSMQGMGLTKEQKEIIEGVAIFDKDSGQFQVKVGTTMKNISQLTKDQAAAFAIEQESLEKRAKEAQTFEEVFQATMNELKSTLLPLLKGLNSFLTTIRPVVEKITDWLTAGPLAWLKVIGAFTTATLLWKGANALFNKGIENFISKGIGSSIGGAGGGGSTKGLSTKKMKAGSTLAKGQGLKSLGTGAGVGMAAVGIGAGVGIAAVGISKLADSMSKLTPKQAEVLEGVVNSLLIFTGIGVALTAVVAAFGSTATAASLGLLAFGAAILMVGGGIAIAALGIGEMAKGLAVLVKDGENTGQVMTDLALGILKVGGAMSIFAGVGALGMLAFGATIATIAASSDSISKVGAAFKEIGAVMSGNKEDYIAVAKAIQSISTSNISSGGMFAELSELLKNPLKVVMESTDVNLRNNITLELDGQVFMNKVYKSNIGKDKDAAAFNSGIG